MSCCPLIALKHAELTHLVPLKLPYLDDEMSLSLAYNDASSLGSKSAKSKSAKSTCLLPKCQGEDACAGADEDNIGCGRFVTFLLGSSSKCLYISNFVAIQFFGLPVALGRHYTCRNIHSFTIILLTVSVLSTTLFPRDEACAYADGIIGARSCIGESACLESMSEIDDDACVGKESCKYSNGKIRKASCLGQDACNDSGSEGGILGMQYYYASYYDLTGPSNLLVAHKKSALGHAQARVLAKLRARAENPVPGTSTVRIGARCKQFSFPLSMKKTVA